MDMLMWLRNNKGKKLYAGIRTGKLLLALSGCLLLAGCQKETESEEQQAAVSDNVAAETDKAENTEIEDAETTDLPDKDVTVISVLGKVDLRIADSRIYDDESGYGYLDNRFTPEEMDTILNAIEGTWIVDEYVGFIPFEKSTWSEEKGTEEERQQKYDSAVERAENNLPDFFFRIKGYSDEEPVDGSHYIYVFNDNKSYVSPISAALCMQEKGLGYPGVENRTIQGSGIMEQPGYPVIYIEFLSISCDEQGALLYEPATLILASNGSFLLLKDGAFYSLKHSIQSQIMSGDFSCLTDEIWEDLQERYTKSADFFEWRQIDLNGDGIEDLILQEKKTSGLNDDIHIIRAIFACQKDEAELVLWDEVDYTEYYFCGPTGEIMYTAPSYGAPILSFEPYAHCYFDRDWNQIRDYELVVYEIDMISYPESVEEWRQEHPDMAEDGIYYKKYSEKGEEILTREELESIYEQETGAEFYSELIERQKIRQKN